MKRETIWVVNVTLTLVCLGVLMVYSAKTITTYKAGNVYDTLWDQLLMVGIAFVAFVFFALFDYHHYRSRNLLRGILIVTAGLLVLVLIIGTEKFGARRWLSFGGFTFQPSEVAKLAIIIFLAVKLSENKNEMKRISDFFPPLFITGLFAAVIFAEDDLGTPVIICAAAMLMMFMGGARWLHTIPTIGLGATGFFYICKNDPERWARLTTFLDPWKDPSEQGFQLIQSLVGFARGSLFGQGPGAGEQKLQYIFAAESDFIFANIGEEMGLVGTLAIVVLFAVFLIMGFNIAKGAADLLGSLLAAGIVSIITMQAALNMAVTTGAAPTKGLPLPFISEGGSALIIGLAMVGILVNIGLQAGNSGDRTQGCSP